jgi:hypothetical protein
MIVIIILIVTVRTEERLVQSINNCNEYQVRSKTPLLVALRYRYFILPAYTTVQILGLHYHPARDNLEVRCSAVLQVLPKTQPHEISQATSAIDCVLVLSLTFSSVVSDRPPSL